MLKSIFKMILAVAIGLSFTTMTASSSSDKGRRVLFSKINTKKTCKTCSFVLAKKHTQAQWKDFFDRGELSKEFVRLCKEAKPLKERNVKDVFDFFHNYAIDSGNVPS